MLYSYLYCYLYSQHLYSYQATPLPHPATQHAQLPQPFPGAQVLNPPQLSSEPPLVFLVLNGGLEG